jgi:hypothetical protein
MITIDDKLIKKELKSLEELQSRLTGAVPQSITNGYEEKIKLYKAILNGEYSPKR